MFLFDTFTNVKHEKHDNIAMLWAETLKLMPPDERQGLGKLVINLFRGTTTSKFDIYKSIYLYVFSFGIILASLLSVVLLVKILMQVISKFGRNRSSHVVPPEHFRKDKNVHAWLDKFELYLTEDNICNYKQRCAALISRLDEECVDMVKHHGARTYDDYGTLKKTLLKLFTINAN